MLEATTHLTGNTYQPITGVIRDDCATSPIQTVPVSDKGSHHISGNSGQEARHTKHTADYSVCALEPPLTIPKLSSRLNTLIQLASSFKIIWDIGCDHGKAGIALAIKNASSEVHCIDRSKHAITKLQSLQLPTNLTATCMNATNVKIHNRNDEIVILAGIGSHTANKIIDGILSETGEYRASFLISIHQNHDGTVAHLASRYGFSTTQHYEINEKKKTYRFDLMSPQHSHS